MQTSHKENIHLFINDKGKSLHLQRVHAAGIRICQKHGLKQWKVCPERQRLPKTEIDKDRD